MLYRVLTLRFFLLVDLDVFFVELIQMMPGRLMPAWLVPTNWCLPIDVLSGHQSGRHQLSRHQSGQHQSADINRGWFILCFNLHEYWGLVSAKKSNAKSNKMTFNMLLAQAWFLNWFFTLVILDYLSRFLVFKPVSKQSLSQKHVENHFVAFCVAFLGRGQASGFIT